MSTRTVSVCLVTLSILIVGCTDRDVSDRPPSSTPAAASNDADPASELRQLLTDFASGTYTATYSIATTGLAGDANGDMQDDVELTITESQRGPDYSRESTTMRAEGQTYSIAVIRTPDVLALCADEVGPLFFFLPLDNRTCIDLEKLASAAELDAILDPLQAIEDQTLDVVDVTERSIGDQRTTCYEVTVP